MKTEKGIRKGEDTKGEERDHGGVIIVEVQKIQREIRRWET